MIGQSGAIYQTQDQPVRLIAWVEHPQVHEGASIEVTIALQNRSQSQLYFDLFPHLTPFANDPHFPFTIAVRHGEQPVPFKSILIRRKVVSDADLIPIASGMLAGFSFDVRRVGYDELPRGSYQIRLWYDSARLSRAMFKTRRLWRGRTSKLEIPIEII